MKSYLIIVTLDTNILVDVVVIQTSKACIIFWVLVVGVKWVTAAAAWIYHLVCCHRPLVDCISTDYISIDLTRDMVVSHDI